MKILGHKSYGSIGHLPSSRLGPADKHITEGQAKIATERVRDRHDKVIVQEKLDGSNVGVALKDGKIYALTRAGYEAHTSPFVQHQKFNDFVYENEDRFRAVLNEGERICGEWLYQAHGTKYDLYHEPFVAFDIFNTSNRRFCYDEFLHKNDNLFVIPRRIPLDGPHSICEAKNFFGEFGGHGAIDPIEGYIWRVERKGKVDFLCKYVNHDKVDGKYLNELIVNRGVNK